MASLLLQARGEISHPHLHGPLGLASGLHLKQNLIADLSPPVTETVQIQDVRLGQHPLVCRFIKEHL